MIVSTMNGWSERFRAHMRRHKLSQDHLGGQLNPQRTQATIGHWLRGIREINLREFFALCAAAGADPREILFGEDSAEAALSTLRAKVLATKPDRSPDYGKFEKSLKVHRNSQAKSRKPVKVTDR